MLKLNFPTKIGHACGYSSTCCLVRNMKIHKVLGCFLSLNPRDLNRENNKEKIKRFGLKTHFLRNPPLNKS